MNFLELAEERYSLRNMDACHPVEKDKLEKIAKAARVSPAACNLQRHRLKIVTSTEGIEKIRRCTTCHFNAPAVIIISLDKDTGSSPMDEIWACRYRDSSSTYVATGSRTWTWNYYCWHV